MWAESSLGNYVRVEHGFAFKGEFFSEAGKYVVLTPGNFHEAGGFRARPGKDRFYAATFPDRYLLSKGDLIVAMTEQGEGLLGSAALIPESSMYLHNQRLGLVKEKSQVADRRFLYYLFNTDAVRQQIRNSSSGAKVRHTSPERIYGVKVRVPPKVAQQKIGVLLSAYDELIENNQRRIALLERMAEEIYREWFVRLRFPGHDKAKFVKGLPVEWDIKRVKEIVVRKGFGRIYREDELLDDGKVIVIDQSRADSLGYYDGEPQHKASSDSPTILFGDHTCKMVLMTKPFSLAENVIPFVPKSNVATYFLFHLVKDLARTTEYKRHWTDLANREVLVPKEALQLEFENVVKRNHEQIEVLQQVIRKAEKTRDLLLPRLISGKLSVENIDIHFPPSMEEATHEV